MPDFRLLAILQTDCPTCRLITPYLNMLARGPAAVKGLSQDPENVTREFREQMDVQFPLEVDADLAVSAELEVVTVPTLYLLDAAGRVVRKEPGFDKNV